MRLFYYIFILLLLQNCTTVEVTKEIIKAGNSVKTSISDAVKKQEENIETEDLEKNEVKIIEKEKKTITIEQKKEENIIETQQKIVQKSFFGNSLGKIKKILGEPELYREDGNAFMLRYDSASCRLFLFFNPDDLNKKVEYFELRDVSGKLIDSKETIEMCFKEFGWLIANLAQLIDP